MRLAFLRKTVVFQNPLRQVQVRQLQIQKTAILLFVIGLAFLKTIVFQNPMRQLSPPTGYVLNQSNGLEFRKTVVFQNLRKNSLLVIFPSTSSSPYYQYPNKRGTHPSGMHLFYLELVIGLEPTIY